MPYTITQPEVDAARDAVLGLWGRNLPEAGPDRHAWLYGQGPARAWLLRDRDGQPVGSAGVMGRTFYACGRPIRAGQAIDLNVDRGHRTLGPALQLQRTVTGAVRQGRLDLVYGFPNSESEAVERRAGYRVLGAFARWVKPLACEDSIKGWLRFPRVRRGASAALDAFHRLRSPETFYRRPPGVRVEIGDRFGPRFDALWDRARGQSGIVGERTAAYLEWRFARSPLARHRVLCVGGPGRELSAYLVYSQRQGKAFISDFFFDSPAGLDMLLAEFCRLMRRQRMRTITTVFLGGGEVAESLARSGFLRRPSTWKTLVYFDPHNERLGAARLLDPESWFLTRADVDTDF